MDKGVDKFERKTMEGNKRLVCSYTTYFGYGTSSTSCSVLSAPPCNCFLELVHATPRWRQCSSSTFDLVTITMNCRGRSCPTVDPSRNYLLNSETVWVSVCHSLLFTSCSRHVIDRRWWKLVNFLQFAICPCAEQGPSCTLHGRHVGTPRCTRSRWTWNSANDTLSKHVAPCTNWVHWVTILPTQLSKVLLTWWSWWTDNDDAEEKKSWLLKMLRMMTTTWAGHMQSPRLPKNPGQGFLGGGGGGGGGGKPLERLFRYHATVLSSNKK